MSYMIKVTKKLYNSSERLIDENFMINADNINYIEDTNNTENWDNSIIFMNDKSTIYVAESKEQLEEIINKKG